MKLKEFIQQNRDVIDECIHEACRNAQIYDDDEREMWIMNDEGLYLWACESVEDL